MKTFFKKSIALALTLLMLITSIPVMNLAGVDLGFTAEAATYQVGDLVSFGSYPQSKVTDSATITALNAKAPSWDEWKSYGYYSGSGSTGSMKQGDWMRYVDIKHDGERYRGVKFTQYRPYWTCYTSSYTNQADNGYNTNTVYWFKFESIDWRVLDPSTGLVMCETIIDSQPYSNTIYSNGGGTYGYFNDASYTNYASDYETSSIREWLNNDFYNTAFTDNEKKEISTTTLNNDGYYTSVGTTGYEKLDSNETKDKIFLLSYNEVRNSNFGFNSSSSAYDTARFGKGSDYAQSQGLYVYRSSGITYNGNSNWVLRSPGHYSSHCCYVDIDGYSGYGYRVSDTHDGVRPALCLDRVSGVIGPDDAVEYKVGDIVQFGSYPQSKVTDNATITALNNLAPAWDNWTSYGYYSGNGDYGTMNQGDWMRYTDIMYNGNKYRGVKFTQYRPVITFDPLTSSSDQSDNGYSINTIYWFKFEPIDWRVLDPETGLVMCETIIDSQPYSNTIYYNSGASGSRYAYFNDSSYTNYANDYETSSIRKWLNNDFYNTAFTDSEKKEINTTTLNNDGWYTSGGTTGYEKLDSNSTNDKIFLLSYNEVRNSNFGFNSNDSANDTARRAQGSDYAQSQGLYVEWFSGDTFNNVSDWLLRSPGCYSSICCIVDGGGLLPAGHFNLVCECFLGVRPALRFNRISDIGQSENGSINNEKSNGTLSNGLKWEVSNDSLTIRGTATNIPNFTRGEAPWSKYSNQIEYIYIFASRIKTIGYYAFYGLKNVRRISIGTEALSQVKKYAFYGIDLDISISFVGTEKQWKKVSIDYGNDTLIGSDIRCTRTDSTVSKEEIPTPSEDIEVSPFFDEHLQYASDEMLINMLDKYSFHNNVDTKGKILQSYYWWEAIGDLGEVLTFKFDDLIINADYYEMYLADMVLKLNGEEKKDDLEWKLAKGYKEASGILLNLFKSSDELDAGLDDNFYDDMAEFFSGKEFKLSEGTQATLNDLLSNIYSKNKNAFGYLFEGLTTTNNVLDIVFKTGDVANGLLKVVDSYVIAKAFYEVNDEFFNVCKEAGRILRQDTSKDKYKDYGRWFLNAVNEAESNMLGSFDAFFESVYTAMLEVGKITYESLFQDCVKAVIYPAIGKIIGVTGGQFNVLTTTYNTTFYILNALFGHGEAGDKYRIMNYITPVEKALQTVVSSRRSDLLSSTEKDESIAIKYDVAYQIHRQTNMYLYENAYSYAAIKKYQEDMETITTLKHRWNILRCHYREYGDEYTLFSAHCPVDVYVYDKEGNLVTSIVDEKITMSSPNVTVMNDSGNKTIAYPTELEYSFVIKAREDGTMDYSISKGTTDEKIIDYKSYDIPLTENQEFSVTIPTEESPKEDYKLNSGDAAIDFDYDYSENCQTHSYDEWIVENENKSRTCLVCGYIECEVICKHKSGTIKAYSIVPTCTTSGHTINICSECGATTNDGEDVTALGHEKSKLVEKIEATCTSKGYEFYECDACASSFVETLPKVEHKLSEWTQSKAPTCTEAGEDIRGCENCSYTESNLISALDHSYSSKTTNPTCTAEGYTIYTCSICGDNYKGDEKAALGHSMGAYTVTIQPTCTDKGIQISTCIRCESHTDTKFVDEKGHNYKDGFCTGCGKSKVENCKHLCHKKGFMGFIWKIIRFFWKLFKMNSVCECGLAHY